MALTWLFSHSRVKFYRTSLRFGLFQWLTMPASDFHSFADQIIDLPKGKLVTLKTYLSMPVSLESRDAPLPDGYAMERLGASDHARYRALFAKVGENWLWFSRLLLKDAALQKALSDPHCHAHALTYGGEDIGLFELQHHTGPHDHPETETDLAFLGLDMAARGRGLGSCLVRKAHHHARLKGARRLTINTCQLDDPRALGFYQKMGFSVEKLALEILTDPRHLGLYPKESAPHIALSPL